MKHRHFCIAMLLPLMVSCGENGTYVDLTYPSYIYHHDDYNEKFKYDDEYFKKSSYEYNPYLARLSLGLCLATVDTNTTGETREQQINKFYRVTGFSDVSFCKDFFELPNQESIGFALSHKKIGDYELVSVVIRSFEYGEEMANNFLLGESGNHQGFEGCATTVYEGLSEYIDNLKLYSSPIKLWVTGFTRGGSVANNIGFMVDKKIAENSMDFSLKENDAYFYTFNAIKSIDAQEASSNMNVHNIINSKDILLLAPPDSYGLKRCGVDHDMYRPDCISLIREFDPTLPFEDFCSKELVLAKEITYVDAPDPYYDIDIFYDHICDVAFRHYDEGISLSNRQEYCDNVQESAIYGFGVFYALTDEQLDDAGEYIYNNFEPSMLLEMIVNKEDVLYRLLYPALDHVGFEYDKDELKKHCGIAQQLLFQLYLHDDHPLDDGATGFGNRRYIEAMHTPEMLSVLLSAEIEGR